jgi:hypothetical protein
MLSEEVDGAGTTAMVTVSPGCRFNPVSVQAGEAEIWNVNSREFVPDCACTGTTTAHVRKKRTDGRMLNFLGRL